MMAYSSGIIEGDVVVEIIPPVWANAIEKYGNRKAAATIITAGRAKITPTITNIDE